MAVALLAEPPLVPPLELGPYRVQDYLDLPDEPRHELIFGRLYVSPSPILFHQITVTLLCLELDRIAQETGGLAAVAPLDVTLAEHSVVQPDVLYVAPDRLSVLRDRVEGAPSLVVEVLSPGTARRDRGEKLRLYADSGVQEYWIVDAIERQVEFLVLRDGAFSVALPRGREYRSPVLAGVQLDLESLWTRLEQRLARIR